MRKPLLSICDFSVDVHLGCRLDEREKLQEVQFTVEIELPSPPLGETTDQLEDSLCYGEVCETLKNFVKGKKFHLIEKMAKDCLSLLEKKHPSTSIDLTVHKITPPIEGLKGGVKYSCGRSYPSETF